MNSSDATARAADRSAPKMKGYREDQGRHARMAAFWSLVLLLLFGCTFLHTQLTNVDSLAVALGGIRIPVVAVDLNGAFLIAGGLFLVGLIAIQRWQRKPKVADLLIDTEAELRKVTWPSSQEVMNSSIVVVVTVVLIGLFLAGADYVLARIMKYLVLGEV